MNSVARLGVAAAAWGIWPTKRLGTYPYLLRDSTPSPHSILFFKKEKEKKNSPATHPLRKKPCSCFDPGVKGKPFLWLVVWLRIPRLWVALGGRGAVPRDAVRGGRRRERGRACIQLPGFEHLSVALPLLKGSDYCSPFIVPPLCSFVL